MKIGFVGLGKLGLPCALAAEAAGHEVHGWDISPEVGETIDSKTIPYVEAGAQELLERSQIHFKQPYHLAEWADLVFVAVQTPHQPEYEGTTRLPSTRADFDYTHLVEAVTSIASAKLVVVVSTVLPGTIDRQILGPGIIAPERLLYNPSFIAMGTTIPDFRTPDLVLIGTDAAHPKPLIDFYREIHAREPFVTTIKTAELTKVAYNTFIGLKIAFANTMMELCEKTGADVDDLVDALGSARGRVVSSAYLRGGMGDGGGCHPRDNIALSWLAKEVELSYDLFEALMICREKQTEWLADLIQGEGSDEVEILGKAYKPETKLTVGSPATLLANILAERGVEVIHKDPYVDV